MPVSAIEIGTIKVKDDKQPKYCNWDATVERAKAEARKTGWNLLEIINQTPLSNFTRSCDVVKAKVYKLENLAEIQRRDNEVTQNNCNYAKLFFLQAIRVWYTCWF